MPALRKLLALLTAAFLALAMALVPAGLADRLTSVQGEPRDLRQLLEEPKTLVLVVRSELELRESFRLITLAEARGLPALALVVLPADQPIQNAAIRRAARRFASSDFTRARLFLAEGEAPAPLATAGAAVLEPTLRPLWLSPSLPADSDFDTPDFQI